MAWRLVLSDAWPGDTAADEPELTLFNGRLAENRQRSFLHKDPLCYTNRLESLEDGTLRRNLGDLLENDPVVSMTDEDEFVAYVVDHLGDSPSEYGTIRLINLGVKKATAEEISELEVGRNECALSK
jgi:hypothetical protein